MSAVTLPRGQISTYFVADLADKLPFPVGDNDKPTESHGWQGEPNADASNYIPWCSLGAGTATNSGGPQSASQADWRLNYFVTTAGVARKQTEAIADMARDYLAKTLRQKILTTNGTWSIQQVRVASIGGVNKVGSQPTYFVQTDTVEIWLSRELT